MSHSRTISESSFGDVLNHELTPATANRLSAEEQSQLLHKYAAAVDGILLEVRGCVAEDLVMESITEDLKEGWSVVEWKSIAFDKHNRPCGESTEKLLFCPPKRMIPYMLRAHADDKVRLAQELQLTSEIDCTRYLAFIEAFLKTWRDEMNDAGAFDEKYIGMLLED